MRRWFINLPDQDLAYFPEGSEGFVDYFRAVTPIDVIGVYTTAATAGTILTMTTDRVPARKLP